MDLDWLFKTKPAPLDARVAAKEAFRVVADYGEFLEKNSNLVAHINDEKMLPHDKEVILASSLLAMRAAAGNPALQETLTASVMMLSQFQAGVGDKPLRTLGIDTTAAGDIIAMSREARKDLLERAIEGKKKYDRFSPLIDADLSRIKHKLDQARLA